MTVDVTNRIASKTPWFIFERLNDLCIFVFVKMVKCFQVFHPNKNRSALGNRGKCGVLRKLYKHSLPRNTTVVCRFAPGPFVREAQDLMPVFNRFFYISYCKNWFNM